MIYPFRVIDAHEASPGVWTVTIELSRVIRYEPSIDPATLYRTPIIEFSQHFYSVEAASQDEALEKVAANVANS